MIKFSVLVPISMAAMWAQTHPLQAIVEAARSDPPALKALLATDFPNLKNQGTALVWGQDFLFIAETAKEPAISIDAQPLAAMARLPDSGYWYRLVKMRTGVTHSYEFHADGKTLFPRRDVAGYNPDSYPKPGVPKGTLSGKHTIASKIYEGSTADYWVYVSPGVDPAQPAPLMVWQDGQGLVNGDLSALRMFTVTENLVAQKLIPPMIHVMISPGTGPRMRSVQYDTVSDRFGRYLLEEVLPEVEKTYKLRADGYSRGIAGESSGAICALNVAWHFPEKFSRVHSTIGSYTALQWHPEENLDGANVYPFLIRKTPRKNIRIWQSDGMDDIENQFGSWPLQAVELANSLKMQAYDFHFRFGEAAHNSAQAALDLPESLAWLWRDYDAAKTEQTYEMDPAERDKPLYRIRIVNRDAW
ncbi:MAG TPA: alpha/beta hydrolase-fold protein [Bryobacteraceae bacterium]|nr:alpha/beta hydrolase-fold protein [Bryobacteraceae bacterium]